VHLVRRGHFRSHDRDVGHTIESIRRIQKHHAPGKLHGSVFIEPELLPIKVLHCGIGEPILTGFAHVTLTLTRWPDARIRGWSALQQWTKNITEIDVA